MKHTPPSLSKVEVRNAMLASSYISASSIPYLPAEPRLRLNSNVLPGAAPASTSFDVDGGGSLRAASSQLVTRTSSGRVLVPPARYRDAILLINQKKPASAKASEKWKNSDSRRSVMPSDSPPPRKDDPMELQATPGLGILRTAIEEAHCLEHAFVEAREDSANLSEQRADQSLSRGVLEATSSKSQNQSKQVVCPFDFCPARLCCGSQVLREHIHRHLLHSRELCLSGLPLASLTHYLQVEGRWLCSRCCRIYIRRRSCACGFSFGGVDVFVADGHPLPSPPPEPEPELTSREISSSFLDDATIFSTLRQSRCLTINFVPKRCRSLLARTFTSLLVAVQQDPKDLKLWARLLIFPKCILRLVPRGTARKRCSSNQAKIIQDRLALWNSGIGGIEQLWVEMLDVIPTTFISLGVEVNVDLQLSQNVRRCKALIRHGRLGDACRSLSSVGVVAPSREVVEALQDKHPLAPPPVLPEGPAPLAISADASAVLRAIKSFPRGTACGRDGLRAQHLSDMLSGVSSIDYDHFVTSLTAHVNLLLRADIPQCLATTLASAPLIALRKPSGGIRPIAVGEIWRRLTSKVAVSLYRGQAQEYLSPLQVGVAVPLGTEAIMHAVNRTVATLGSVSSRGMLKFDFENAFNTISRDKVLSGVRQHFPGLSRWVEFIYASQPTLYVGDAEILSSTGVQQGDPLGPLLFAIALQPLLLGLEASFPNLDINAWYLDDGTIVGGHADLLGAFHFVQNNAPLYGLRLNEAKCEVWWPGLTPSSWIDFPHTIQRVCTPTIGLLGGLIIHSSGTSPSVDAEMVVLRRVSDITCTLQHLRELSDPHMQLLLLRACCGYPKFNFALRTCPTSCIPIAIKRFDQAVEESLSDIWNAGFNLEQRQLISLPLRLGGLSIPLASRSAMSAFAGSAAQSVTLQHLLMRNTPLDEPGDWVSLALDSWNVAFSYDEPVPLQDLLASRNPQHLLSEKADTSLLLHLRQNASPRFKAVINAATVEYSAVWTTALPLPYLGQTMSPAAFRKALLYRTGHPLYAEPRRCTLCTNQTFSDTAGDHDAICRGGARLVRRHNMLRDTLFNLARSAHLAPRKEETYLFDDSADRPADILLPSWAGGRDLCVDVSVVSPFVSVGLNQISGAAAQAAEQRKMVKYERRCDERNLLFTPFILETTGGFGAKTEPLLRRLAVALADVEHSEVPNVMQRIRQQISFTVQRATAEGFLMREET